MGLSHGVTVHCGTSFANERHTRRVGSPKPRKVKLNKTCEKLREAQQKHHERMAMLSFQERQDLLDVAQNDINMEFDGDDAWEDDNDEDVMLSVPPPGEEGFFLSHAGGEAVLQQIFVDSLSKRKRHDFRTRQDRVEHRMQQWRIQLPDLINAYLSFRAYGPCILHPKDPGRWHIEVINLETRGLHPFTHVQSTPFASVTLILHGYIGSSPNQPHLAFSIQLLAFYQQLRHVHPRFSFDAFAKCLNHFHLVAHTPYLADQLSNAYDCYLEIIRENELKLKFEFLATMDGNNSLKLVDSTYCAGAVRTDGRKSQSPCWISPEDVDLFKDEVGKTTRQGAPTTAESTEDLATEEIAWLNVTEHDDLAKCLNTSRKKMFALFAVAGIFLAVCRHGHVLVICDMIRSGELYNYRQALEQIEIDTPQLATLSAKLGVSGEDYEHYLELERAYLAGLQAEPENVKATADYMEQLFKLDNLKYIFI
ncbi:hypothetical protein BYT27DRAFT_7231816 [Phlegmacium glaucopus]|nr:hypothetical protein BYT27DRAFT_7231816 [Phlegmacium glaucopus]